MKTPYLRLEGIRKVFGSFQALADIDLSIDEGEFVCFLGPSGCGKTTLLRIIAGLETQSAGAIFQSGRDISRLPPAERDYGIVFQSYALFPNLTVKDNVAYGLVNRKMPRAKIATRVDELLLLVGLPGSGPKFAAQLSGGQQQRVALARALATSPGLLLLDEPLSALDALERVRLRGEIRSLQKKLGVTTVMVTHDQEEALSIADRIVVMNQGAIEQVGTPLEVYREPHSVFVADFVGKANRLAAVVDADGTARCGPFRLPVPAGAVAGSAVTGSAVTGSAVTLYLRPEDRAVEGLTEGQPHLCTGIVRHIDFLGGYCIAEVEVEGLPERALSIQLSLNQLQDLDVREGAPLRFALRAERMRVFPAAA